MGCRTGKAVAGNNVVELPCASEKRVCGLRIYGD